MLRKILEIVHKILLILDKQQKCLGAVVLLCALLAAVFETVGVSVIIPLVNVLLDTDALWNNVYVSIVTSFLHIETDEKLIIMIIGGVIFIYVLKNLFFSLYAWLRVKYANKIERETTIRMMNSYMSRGYKFFLSHNYSEILQGAAGDVDSLYHVIINLLQAISQITVCIFICAFMIITDWQLALALVATAVICLVLIVVVFRRAMLSAGIVFRENAIKSSKVFTEAFHGIKEVLVMRKQKYFIDEYEKYTIKKQNAQVMQTVGGEIPAYIIEAICISGIMVVLCVRIINIENPGTFISTLAAFAVGAFRILPALGKISVAINNTSTAIPGVDSVYENIVEARDYNLPYNSTTSLDEEAYVNMEFSNSIEVRDVTFAYDKEVGNVLEAVNLKVNKGQSIALVGESGAGKSTLADIILGVLDADEGKILVDGIDIHMVPNRWSELIGFVPQSIYLADVSVRENVAFGEPEECISDERVRHALEQANLLNFVDELPDGIYTHVGDRGVRLSGGQRQRIGIARALYRAPEILVLDEATSALDNDTEESVMEAIESLQGRITLIIIAHRLTTVRKCDRIYKIVNGKAVERKYEDLV